MSNSLPKRPLTPIKPNTKGGSNTKGDIEKCQTCQRRSFYWEGCSHSTCPKRVFFQQTNIGDAGVITSIQVTPTPGVRHTMPTLSEGCFRKLPTFNPDDDPEDNPNNEELDSNNDSDDSNNDSDGEY